MSMPGPGVRADAVLPGQAGDRARGRQLPARRVHHRGQPAVRGDPDSGVFFMRVHFSAPAPGVALADAASGLRGVGRRVPDALADPRCGRRADARADHGLAVRALPQRPAVPRQHRRAAGRDRRRGLQPRRLRRAGRVLRHPVPPPAGRRRTTKAAAEAAAARARRERERRAGGAGPLHADAVGRRCASALEGRIDQHPPLVPAELQGRQALPPGARARREADRRDRALRDRRPRRGADHRAGRGAGRPHACRPSSWSSARPRRRVPGRWPAR